MHFWRKFCCPDFCTFSTIFAPIPDLFLIIWDHNQDVSRPFPGRFLPISGRFRLVSYHDVHLKPIWPFCRPFQTCSCKFPDPYTPFHDHFPLHFLTILTNHWPFWPFQPVFLPLQSLPRPFQTILHRFLTQTPVTYMAGGIDPFCQSPGTYLAQGLHGVGYFIWKVFSVPYHILIHDKTLLGAISVSYTHLTLPTNREV